MKDVTPAVRIVMQARTTSTRLPGKALLPIAGRPCAVLALERVGNRGVETILATSCDPSDDCLAATAMSFGHLVHRGPLDDVLSRYCEATSDLPSDAVVVRVTADNVLPDGDLCNLAVRVLCDSGADIASVEWPGSAAPYGIAVEAIRLDALRRADRAATAVADREHVTPWIYRHGRAVSCGSIGPEGGAAYSGTIDTLADYLVVATLFDDEGSAREIAWDVLCRQLIALSRDRRGDALPPIASPIGHTSELVLGTAQLGLAYGRVNRSGEPTHAAAVRRLLSAHEQGVRAFDTARAYGSAEERVGAALRNGRSPAPTVITKLAPMPEGRLPEDMALAVDASVFASTTALGVRRIDSLLLHRWRDRARPGVWDRLLELQANGIIGLLGASVQSPEEAIEAIADPQIRLLQLPMNILDKRWREMAVPEALMGRPDIAVHARSVLLQGVLLANASDWPIDYSVARGLTESIDCIAAEFGRAVMSLCVNYVRGLSWVHSLVMGVDSDSQLDEVVSVFREDPLTAEQVNRVDQLMRAVPPSLLDPTSWS